MPKFLRFVIWFAMIAPFNPALAFLLAGVLCQFQNKWDDVL